MCALLVCCILGDWRSLTVQRERVWSDDGQEEALWLAGPDFGQIRPHGQWLLCVRNHHTVSEYHCHPYLLMLLLDLQFRHKHHHALWLPIVIRINRATCCFAGLLWRSWTFWTHCQRLKWAWPIRLMENLYLVSPVGHFPHFSIKLLKHLEMVKMHLRGFTISAWLK